MTSHEDWGCVCDSFPTNLTSIRGQTSPACYSLPHHQTQPANFLDLRNETSNCQYSIYAAFWFPNFCRVLRNSNSYCRRPLHIVWLRPLVFAFLFCLCSLMWHHSRSCFSCTLHTASRMNWLTTGAKRFGRSAICRWLLSFLDLSDCSWHQATRGAMLQKTNYWTFWPSDSLSLCLSNESSTKCFPS